MHVFVTGASGWIGGAAVAELVAAGHRVTGLARSDRAAQRVAALGAGTLRGDLDDLAALRSGAAGADAVLHLANKHDWADPAESDRAERAAVEVMLEAGPAAFMVANGLTGIVAGRAVLETDPSPEVGPTADRGGSENLVLESSPRGLAIRFAPSVHGTGDWGFVAFLTAAARERGVSGYVGDGSAQWSAVHRGDAARLIRLGLESAPAGTRLHAVAEEALDTRDIAAAIGAALDLPVASVDPADAGGHFGIVGEFFAQSLVASAAATRQLLGWNPSGPGLLDDIRAGAYTGP